MPILIVLFERSNFIIYYEKNIEKWNYNGKIQNSAFVECQQINWE